MNTKTNQSINIGVDTGKFQLDIYIRPLDIYFTVANNEKGIKEAINKIKKQQAPLKCHLLWHALKLVYLLSLLTQFM